MSRTGSILFAAALVSSCAATVPLEEHNASLKKQESDYEDRIRRAHEDHERREKTEAKEKGDLEAAKRASEERIAQLESALADKQRTLDDVTSQLLELQDAFSKLSSKERSQIEAVIAREKAKQATLGELETRLKTALAEELKAAKVEVSTKDDAVTVRFKDGTLFGKGASRIAAPAKAALDRLAAAMKQSADTSVRVEVHTDSVRPKEGDAGDTWALTQQQGLALVQTFAKGGVDPSRLAYTSYGQFRPVATNDTPEGRAQNRRVEIVLALPRTR